MCSYCGCESIAVVGRFMAEHVQVVNALTALRTACHAGDLSAVGVAVDVLESVLHPHTHAEEVGLFALLREDPEFTGTVDRLCSEHADLDARLDRLRAGDLGSFEEFERAMRGHIDREENGLFPASAIRFAGPEWDRVDALTPPA